MPSPDVSRYVDLTLYDATATDLVNRALSDAVVKMPGWVPRPGDFAVVLAEGLALTVADWIFVVNRLPGAITEVMMGLLGIDRGVGTAPVATATFALSDTLGHIVPAGTVLRLAVNGTTTVDVTTDVPLAVGAGSASGTVAVTGTTRTSTANGIVATTPLTLVTPVPYVESVVLATDVSAGTDPEDTATWLSRSVLRFARLTETLVLPQQFQDYALEWNSGVVWRAKAIDNWDGTGSSPGTVAGHITVAVIGSGGATLSPAGVVTVGSAAGTKTDLATAMDALAEANLAVHVTDPTITNVAITSTVKVMAGYDTTAVHDAIVAALTDYLSPDTWGWGTTVYRYELISLIDRVEGVDRVVSLTVPAADVTLTGNAPLAKYDSGGSTITVTT